MENSESRLDKVTDAFGDLLTGVPAPIRKNFFKACGQLCTAAVDVPIAWLEGISAEMRATSDARIHIIRKEGEVITGKIDVPKEYVSRASEKYAAKIIREQINLDEITKNAANELSSQEYNNHQQEQKQSELSDDWLNEFENCAKLKSSEDMKMIFGKILSGEIQKPGTFSIRTVRLISQLDNQAAKLFQLLCSQSISMYLGDHIFDARVVSLSGNAASNSLSQYGLSFDNLNVLQEYGLIISDYNSQMPYAQCIANEHVWIGTSIRFGNKLYGLVPSDREKYDKVLKIHGVALSKSAKELLNTIPLTPVPNYESKLREYFESKHLKMVEVSV